MEHFDAVDLKTIYLRQRLLVFIAKEVIESYNVKLKRDGDDLYFEDKKLSVCIACKGVTSTKIHLGINVKSKGVEHVKIIGLEDLGIKNVDEVMVVFKAYLTRVGTGPMDNELSAEETEQKGWAEFGTVTGRPRRAAEFDFELAQRAIMLSSATQLAITKLDVRFPECAGVKSFSDLSDEAKSFIKNIEDKLQVRVMLIGTGPLVDDIIDIRFD